MGVDFLHPLLLILLPVCLIPVVFLSFKYIQNKFERALFTTIRALVITLIILSLCGVTFMRFSDVTTNIFVVDLSASMEGSMPAILDAIKTANASRSEKERVGVVCFAENAVVDAMPDASYTPADIHSFVERGFTNIASGLRLAQSILPHDTKKQLILVSDGQENVDDAFAQARLLSGQGVAVSVMPVQNLVTKEVQLTDIITPKYLKKDSKYDIEITGYALTNTEGRLFVYKNNALITDEAVSFRKGENRFVFSDVADTSGSVIYRAEISPESDTFPENNIVYGFSHVEGAPSLLVADNNGSGAEIVQLLESAKVNVTQVSPQSLPASMAQLSLYDGVILANVPLDTMPEAFPPLLESYVKNTGGGLLVTGGDESYALGDYKDTPLETALPVNMELKDKDKLPDLGMVVVVDRSGSMGVGPYGVSKMELAKEAVIRSLETLNPKDSLGVLAFDDGYYWASNFQIVGENKTQTSTDIANITLGGGTSILPALYAAYDTISQADTKLKHIILLTDGQAEQSGYSPLIDQMNAAGITLSTVAVGMDSDINLLSRLAREAGGRYYYSDEFTDLPKIFAKETSLVGKAFLNNDSFSPVMVDASPILADIHGVPGLSGYVSTTAKDRADIVLESPKQEPVLATWQYGLGRSAAWTSDMAGMWTAEWLSSNEGQEIFKNIVSWILRTQMAAEQQLKAEVSSNGATLTVTMPYSEGVEAIHATVTAPDMATHDVTFKAAAPGQFKGVLNQSAQGAYIANLVIEKITGAESLSTGVSIPYSSEYDVRRFDKGEGLLKRIAEAGGGRVITSPEEVYGAKTSMAYGRRDLSGLSLALALCLFVLDVALRRFPAVSRQLALLLSKADVFLTRRNRTRKKSLFTKKTANTDDGYDAGGHWMQTEKVPEKPAKSAPAKPEHTAGATSSALVTKKKKRMK